MTRMLRTTLVGLGLLMGSGVARAETPPIPSSARTEAKAPKLIDPPEPGLYATGDLPLAPGMTLYIFRPVAPTRSVEIGRMKVLGVEGQQVKLELLSGTSAMRSGDRLEVEASAPESWEGFAASSAPAAPAAPSATARAEAALP